MFTLSNQTRRLLWLSECGETTKKKNASKIIHAKIPIAVDVKRRRKIKRVSKKKTRKNQRTHMNHLCIFILNLFRALCFAFYRHWIATNAATIGTYTNPFACTHTHTPRFGQPQYTHLMLTQSNLLHLRRPLSLFTPCYSFVYFRRLRITYLNYRDFFLFGFGERHIHMHIAIAFVWIICVARYISHFDLFI